MNTEFFIAKRIISGKDKNSKISNPIIRIAVIGIAVGMTVMILSVAISTGFKSAIMNKIISFGSHIQLTNYESNNAYESLPISKNQAYIPSIKNLKGIKHIQVFGNKAGIIKTKDEIQGVILKGIGSDYDWTNFDKNIISGHSFKVQDSIASDRILISNYLASLLKFKLGDNVSVYFIQEPIRMRKFKIEGIYKTNIEDFDKTIIFADIAHVQKLNNWDSNKVGGYEILLNNFEDLDVIKSQVDEIVVTNYNKDVSQTSVMSIKERYRPLFDWISLFDANVWVILILMLVVAGFNMVSGLLILILERTNMIGILKALGAENKSIRKIFLYNGAYLISKGLFWGNLIGISLCLIQHYFGIVKLDEVSYYVSVVPVELKLFHLILLNVGTLVCTVSMLIIPSYFIAKINTIKAIEFN